jgi:hypothetical protein
MEFVDGPKISGKVMEAGKRLQEGVFNQVPIAFVKGGAKAIWAWARVIVHGEEGVSDLLQGEGADKGVGLRGG